MVIKPFNVLVVDDDFMIARLHAKYIESLDDYSIVGISHNYEQTITLIQEKQPDLLILDVYLPDRSGIELLHHIRSQRMPCDVILITASKELEVVEEGFRLGIFNYLIKPFDLGHLKETLIKYKQFKTRLTTTPNLDQARVDELRKMRYSRTTKELQTGIDYRTLERIKKSLSNTTEFQSADEIAKLSGVSRSTARSYLTYLLEENFVEENLFYGVVGRPQRKYRSIK